MEKKIKWGVMQKAIYDFTVKDAMGGDYKLSALKGKVLLVDLLYCYL